MLVLVLDDLFALHHRVLPGVGVPAIVGTLCYLLVLGLLVACAGSHARRRHPARVPGLGGLAVSVGGDKLEDVFEVSDPTLSHLLGNAEDISKFVGYAALCYVLVVFARSVVNQLVRGNPTVPAPDASDAATAAFPIPATAE